MSSLLRHWKPLAIIAFVLWSWNVTGTLWKPLLALVVVGAGLFGWWARRRVRSLAEVGMRPSARGLWDAWRAETKHRAALVRWWPVVSQKRGLTKGDREKTPLRLLSVKGTLSSDLVVRVAPKVFAIEVDEVAKASSAIASTVGCKEVVVREVSPGVAELTLYWSDPLSRILPVKDLPASKPGQIAYGIRRDGSPATIEWDKSVLIGGATGSGKSCLVWAMLADLVRKGVWVDLYVSDPKGGIELSRLGMHEGEQLGRLKVRKYVKSSAETVKMVEQAEKAMRVRQGLQKDRKLTEPTKDNPLVVVLLDELLPLAAMLKKGADSPLGSIAYEGRASLYVIWANAQIGHSTDLGTFRNLIPQRVSLRTTTTDTTDTILGSQAEARGAKCSKLDMRRDVGVGFSASHDGSLDKFRAALVRDEDMERVAAGNVPTGMSRGSASPVYLKRCAVYRCYDAQGKLLYVGISQRPRTRFLEHARDPRKQDWWGDVVHPIDVAWLADEKAARKEEARAIRDELPRYNVVHNHGWNPLRRTPRRQAELGPVVEGPVLDVPEQLSIMGSE